jgi:DNA polymerase-3 subunit delta'
MVSGAQDRLEAVSSCCRVELYRKKRPCGQCAACKKIRSGVHPDLHIIRPLKTSIGIEQVLTLQEKIYRKIYEGKYKVCVLEEADKLSLPAANALLKIAEEPPDYTVSY